MKALYFEKHGELDEIRYGKLPDPVAVSRRGDRNGRACALNPLDMGVRRGWPGRLVPVIARRMPLSRGKEAYGIMERGEMLGKIALPPE